MKAYLLLAGQREGNSIYIVGVSRAKAPVAKFLNKLATSHPEVFRKVMGVVQQHATTGIVFNETISRRIKGKKNRGLFEFKVKVAKYGTARLIYFYFGAGRTLIVVGCYKVKAKVFNREVAKALKLMKDFKAKGTFE